MVGMAGPFNTVLAVCAVLGPAPSSLSKQLFPYDLCSKTSHARCTKESACLKQKSTLGYSVSYNVSWKVSIELTNRVG